MSGLFNDRRRDGADIERELRKQQRERTRRDGPSTAALEARVWFEVVEHLPDHSVSRIVDDCADILTEITGIQAKSKLRSIVTAARASRGMRLHLGGWGGFEADAAYAQAAEDAQAEAARHRAEMAERGRDGGQDAGRLQERRVRDVIAKDAAAGGGSADHRLKRVNDALAAEGFDLVSSRTLRRILKKVDGSER